MLSVLVAFSRKMAKHVRQVQNKALHALYQLRKSAAQQEQNLSAHSKENKIIMIQHTEKTEMPHRLVAVILSCHFIYSLSPSYLLTLF